MKKSTLITDATLIDAPAGVAREDMNILIEDECIVSVSASVSKLTTSFHIDAGGAYVCPGLIDGHVHLFLDAGPAPRVSFLNTDDETKLQIATRNAALAIAAGVTTVRDCGGPADLVFRFQKEVHAGHILGPRIVAAGSPLTRPQGHCHFFGIEVSTAAEVRRAIDSQVRSGAGFVKLIASGGGLTPGTRPSEADLAPSIMREAVVSAKANGVHVSAHCHAVESIVHALDTGVDIIEHASFVRPHGPPKFDPEIAARIKDQGVIVSPTAISGVRIAQTIRECGMQNGHDHDAVARLESRRRHVANFLQSGVPIVAGTDCGVANTPFDSIVDELLEYVNAGMSTAAALRSATSDSARYLGVTGLGRLEKGCFADLIFLSGNPLENLNYLRTPLLVMKGGEIVCNTRPAPVAIP